MIYFIWWENMEMKKSIEEELEEWLDYLKIVEPPNQDKFLLTEWRKQDIKYTRNMISKLRKEINERNK